MTRGAIRPTTIAEAVERARSMIGFVPEGAERPIAYRLRGGFNGGADPFAPHPGSWSPPDGQRLAWSASGAYTCDCAGFVCWALGLDRWQPGPDDEPGGDFALEAGGYEYVNTDSMIRATRSAMPTWFAEVDRPELGALVVYGSTFRRDPKTRKRERARPGHVGLVVGLPAEWDPAASGGERRRLFGGVRVVHCSSGNQRRLGAAIAETDASIWWRRGRWLRYLRSTTSE